MPNSNSIELNPHWLEFFRRVKQVADEMKIRQVTNLDLTGNSKDAEQNEKRRATLIEQER